MFAEITSDEAVRLHLLTKDIKTEDDIRSALGDPTETYEPGIISCDAEKDGEPPHVRTARSLRYSQHSDTAIICVIVYRSGAVQLSFTGKRLGCPQ